MKHYVTDCKEGRGDEGEVSSLTGLSLAAGVLGGFVICRRLLAPRQMPYLYAMQRALAEGRGEVEATMLAARVRGRYGELHTVRPRFANLALRFHLERNILPGLALFQVLCEESDDREAALAETEMLFGATFKGLRGMVNLLGRLPDPFPLHRRIAHWVSRFGFPPPGWEIEPVEDSDQCIAFNVHRCFYLDVLTAYGARDLTALYCKMDDITYAALPPSIAWERTKTLGRGDDCCDFRWSRTVPDMVAAGTP